MAFVGSSSQMPSPQAESIINHLQAELASERAFSNTLRGYLHGWERLYKKWREDFEHIRHQDTRIHQLEHDLALERRENRLLSRENDIMHEERELQYLRRFNPQENGQDQQLGEGSQRHQGARENSREPARTFLDPSRVTTQRSNPTFSFDGRADDGSDDLYEADDDDIQEAYRGEPIYEDDVRLPSRLQETFADAEQGLHVETSTKYEGDTMVYEDSGYESATAIDSNDGYDSEDVGSQGNGGDRYESDDSEGTRIYSSEDESSDTAVIFPSMRDRLVRTLTRFAFTSER